MIFVTVGAQMAFDRLIRAVDEWAGRKGRGDVFAQIGPTDDEPSHIGWVKFIEPHEYWDYCQRADRIVAHAGTGSILTALQLGKPIVVMPRRAALGETRNDHQVATVERFKATVGVEVAMDETELGERLDKMTDARYAPPIGPYASPQLIEAIRRFIDGHYAVT